MRATKSDQLINFRLQVQGVRMVGLTNDFQVTRKFLLSCQCDLCMYVLYMIPVYCSHVFNDLSLITSPYFSSNFSSCH